MIYMKCEHLTKNTLSQRRLFSLSTLCRTGRMRWGRERSASVAASKEVQGSSVEEVETWEG